MFTQCSKCETVFKLSAEALRTAGGQVRCGRCGEVFSALARLAEEPNAFIRGESPLDLETRADNILESAPGLPAEVVSPSEFEPTEALGQGIQHAQLFWRDLGPPQPGQPQSEQSQSEQSRSDQPLAEAPLEIPEDDSSHQVTDSSMEFTLPPGELDRIFVESKAWNPTLHPAAVSHREAQLSGEAVKPSREAVTPSVEVAKPSAEVVVPNAEAAKLSAGAVTASLEVATPSAQQVDPVPTSIPIELAPLTQTASFEVSEEVRRAVQMEVAAVEQFADAMNVLTAKPRPDRRSTGAWLGAGALLILLAGQVIHQYRESLANREPLGAVLRSLYSLFGTRLPEAVQLSAYQLRQWGVTGDPNVIGTLRMRASIMNAAAHFQPYPLLRVTLANRFGSRIGTRDFEPFEYLGKPAAPLLAPGERIDATLDILDPGKNAEGFEIDVCIRGSEQKISCANDDAARKK